MTSNRRTVTLEAPTAESLHVDIKSTATPVGTAPGFALTAAGTRATVATSYTAGTWATAYGTILDDTGASVTSAGETTARTPTIGVAGTMTVASGTRYWLWVKTVAGSETAVELAGTIVVP
jgi:hypothetical protein